MANRETSGVANSQFQECKRKRKPVWQARSPGLKWLENIRRDYSAQTRRLPICIYDYFCGRARRAAVHINSGLADTLQSPFSSGRVHIPLAWQSSCWMLRRSISLAAFLVTNSDQARCQCRSERQAVRSEEAGIIAYGGYSHHYAWAWRCMSNRFWRAPLVQ